MDFEVENVKLRTQSQGAFRDLVLKCASVLLMGS